MSTVVVELYQALREAGVAEPLAREAARAVLGSDMKNELATKRDLTDLRALTKADLGEFRAELRTEFAEFRTEVRTELADFRTEVRTEIADFRTEVRTEIADFRTEVGTELAAFRTELASTRIEMIKWTVGAMTALTAIFAAISRLG